MKIIDKITDTEEGRRFDLNPDFLDILARDPIEAMNVIDRLEHSDKKQWREVIHMFAVSGVQRAYDDLQQGIEERYCDGKKDEDDEND